MAFDNASLQATHNLVLLNVSSAHQISNRTSAVISRLNPREKSSDDQATVLVALTAKAKAAGKLISIVEIAKRELANDGVKCFQYTALSSEMIDIERRSKKASHGADVEDESDDAFEPMKDVKESATKKRSVPMITIYLSRRSVKELKAAFGHEDERGIATVAKIFAQRGYGGLTVTLGIVQRVSNGVIEVNRHQSPLANCGVIAGD